jgi:hypothetical protein
MKCRLVIPVLLLAPLAAGLFLAASVASSRDSLEQISLRMHEHEVVRVLGCPSPMAQTNDFDFRTSTWVRGQARLVVAFNKRNRVIAKAKETFAAPASLWQRLKAWLAL